jgi:hypothetical protein
MARRPLPPDLDRVGEDLVAGASRQIAARQHRRALATRMAGTAVAALLAGAVLLPAALGPSTRNGASVLFARTVVLDAPALPAACDQPHGGRLRLAACATADPMRIGRPRRW